MLTKEKVRAHLKDMPEEFTFDELVEQFYMIHKIEQRLEEAHQDPGIADEDFDAEMEKWLK